MNATEHDIPHVTLDFEVVGITTKFFSDVTFPIVLLRSVPTPEISHADPDNLSLASQSWLNERIAIVRELERN